jgi:hypothetical protein
MNFPEFSRTRRFDGFIARVFDTPCRYDIILGRNFLSQFQVDPCFSTGTTKWLEMEVPMKPPSFWNDPFDISQVLFASEEEKGVTTPLDGDESIDDHDPLYNFAVDIKESKYEKISPDQVASNKSISQPSNSNNFQRSYMALKEFHSLL